MGKASESSTRDISAPPPPPRHAPSRQSANDAKEYELRNSATQSSISAVYYPSEETGAKRTMLTTPAPPYNTQQLLATPTPPVTKPMANLGYEQKEQPDGITTTSNQSSERTMPPAYNPNMGPSAPPTQGDHVSVLEAQVVQSMDSVINEAVENALRDRDRNIVNAAVVNLESIRPSKAELQALEEERAKKRKKMFIYTAVVVSFLISGAAVFLAVSSGGNDEAPDFPLKSCEGGCQSNEDCSDDLVCFERNIGEASNIPGCPGGDLDFSGTNYCSVSPDPPLRVTNGRPSLGLCEGDCNSDTECAEGFTCFQRDAFEPVPGCSGGIDDESRTDYCIPKPDGPTGKPTTAPSFSQSLRPTLAPPSAPPTSRPSATPTSRPTQSPTTHPSTTPTFTTQPSNDPTPSPTFDPDSFDRDRLDAIAGSLYPDFEPPNRLAFDWLVRRDTWVPPEGVGDPVGLWRERYAVASILFAGNGTELVNSESVCDWNSRIVCNNRGKVGSFGPRWRYASGSVFPSDISALTELTHLDYSFKPVGGKIPKQLGELTLLTLLDLYGNYHTGTIPTELGNLTNLRRLNVRTNLLTGTLPSELGRLTGLDSLRFHENSLEGTVPSEFLNLVQLTDLTGCQSNSFSDTSNVPIECWH